MVKSGLVITESSPVVRSSQSQCWGTATPSSSHRLPRISRKSGVDLMVQEGCGRTMEGEGWSWEGDLRKGGMGTSHPFPSRGRRIEKDASRREQGREVLTPPLHTMKARYLCLGWLSGFLLRANKSSGLDGYYCMTTNRDRCHWGKRGTCFPSSSRQVSCSRPEPGGGPGGGDNLVEPFYFKMSLSKGPNG